MRLDKDTGEPYSEFTIKLIAASCCGEIKSIKRLLMRHKKDKNLTRDQL
jgi:hypothetical protein